MTKAKISKTSCGSVPKNLKRHRKSSSCLRSGSDLNLFTQVPETELLSVNGLPDPPGLWRTPEASRRPLINKTMAVHLILLPSERMNSCTSSLSLYTRDGGGEAVSFRIGQWVDFLDQPRRKVDFQQLVIHRRRGDRMTNFMPGISQCHHLGNILPQPGHFGHGDNGIPENALVMVSFFCRKELTWTNKERGTKSSSGAPSRAWRRLAGPVWVLLCSIWSTKPEFCPLMSLLLYNPNR